MNNAEDIENIEALKRKNIKKSHFSDKDKEALRKKAEKIIIRNEEEARRKKLEEMEHFYEFGLYA